MDLSGDSIDEVCGALLLSGQNNSLQKSSRRWIEVRYDRDGVSDAQAFAQADDAIGMSTGADVDFEGAGITLLKVELVCIVRARRLAGSPMRSLRHNLFFALIEISSGVAVAAGLLIPLLSLLISRMFAIYAMCSPYISVGINPSRCAVPLSAAAYPESKMDAMSPDTDSSARPL